MASNSNNNSLWYFLLFSITAGLIVSFYYVTVSFDYQWTWEKIPRYFVHLDKQTIRTPFDGTVKVGSNMQLLVVGDDGQKQSFTIPSSMQEVEDGDTVFEGDDLGYTKQWRIGPLILGLFVTLKLSFVATIIALLIGIATGLARISKNPLLKWPSLVYVEVIRGTPLLVQLFIIYFMVGSVVGIESRFVCGVLALALFAGAYAGEIIRAGIQSIHFGQMEAAKSLGMNYTQSMIYVILPQVFKRSLPALAGTFISLVKDSSLVSVMALTDLTKSGREIVSASFMVFEVWLTVALLYFIITFGLSWAVKRLEVRLAVGERG
ncbi:MAG: amino acid ABC transporter permease [Bacteriovoracaceae bacterium]|nr:amino acid ABC transporter permease [Bacteriovoracaceae bacterium]